MSDLARFARYLLRYRWTLAGSLVCAVLASVSLGGAVGLLNPLFEDLAPGAAAASPATKAATGALPLDDLLPDAVKSLQAGAKALVAPAMNWLKAQAYVRIPLAIVFFYLIKGIFSFLAVYGLQRVGLQAIFAIREELYQRAVSQSDAFYRVHGTAEMQSRILGDVSRLQQIVGGEIAQTIQGVPAIIVLLAISFAHAWQVTTLCLVTIPAFGWAAGRFGRRIKVAARRSQEGAARLAGLIEETLIARRVVHAFEGIGYEVRRFRDALTGMLRQDLKVARANAATPPSMEILGAVVGAGLIIYAGWLLHAGRIEAKGLSISVLSLLLVFNHVRRLSTLNNTLQQASASARRLFDVLDEPVTVQDAPDAVALPPFRDRIRFAGAWFDYGRGGVLRGVDLELRAGEVHALVGPSGAGKSTISMLVPRFADPTDGTVSIDGHDLRGVTLHSLRSQIALVTQETHLFDDTVAANIAYGSPGASLDAIRAAARASHAEEFILQLPEGYDTRLGERGGRLSSGQRQRIAIARAFLKNAPILILDEATSQLDPAAERVVQEALEALLAGRTALIIAHRLHTVTKVDRIHVVENGTIAESGTHAELMARGGRYAHLFALQSAGAVD